ncbi:hypothetical protein ACHWQZ_G006232 [Mnemiopsis leidyi]
MVNEEVIKKKKKKKKRQSDVAGLDMSVSEKLKKKKKVAKKLEDGEKKKKKRKKSLKNSTMIFDPPEPVLDSQEDPAVVESDQELFGSQSPAFSPIKSQESPIKALDSPKKFSKSPIKSQESSPGTPSKQNPQNGVSEDETDVEPDVSPAQVTPVKRSPADRPSPIIKFAKKTKIVSDVQKVKKEKSSFKRRKVDHESDASGAEEDDKITPLPSKDTAEYEVAPLSDPLISQADQDRRDLTLLVQIKERFPGSQVEDINWNNLFVFNMKPDEMASRYELLLKNIPRMKNNSTLVDEALVSFCHAKVRDLPSSKMSFAPGSASAVVPGNHSSKKKLNAFSLFSSTFDLRKVSREEIREQWEGLEKSEKARLKKEARILNNIHGITGGLKTKTKPRALSAYQVFSKEHMNLGMKMTEVGAKWKSLEESQRKEYQTIADETNRERTASANEQSSP